VGSNPTGPAKMSSKKEFAYFNTPGFISLGRIDALPGNQRPGVPAAPARQLILEIPFVPKGVFLPSKTCFRVRRQEKSPGASITDRCVSGLGDLSERLSRERTGAAIATRWFGGLEAVSSAGSRRWDHPRPSSCSRASRRCRASLPMREPRLEKFQSARDSSGGWSKLGVW
jgi:hypothetical protein